MPFACTFFHLYLALMRLRVLTKASGINSDWRKVKQTIIMTMCKFVKKEWLSCIAELTPHSEQVYNIPCAYFLPCELSSILT